MYFGGISAHQQEQRSRRAGQDADDQILRNDRAVGARAVSHITPDAPLRIERAARAAGLEAQEGVQKLEAVQDIHRSSNHESV